MNVLRTTAALSLLIAWALSCKTHPPTESRAAAKTTTSAAAPKVLWLGDEPAAPIASASATAPVTPKPPEPVTDGRYRVAAMGDSITDARSHGGKYLNYLKDHCPQSLFDNYGVGGQMVNQMRRRFDVDVLQKRVGPEQLPYTHVIIFGGVNDLYSDITANRSNGKIEADLAAMYGAAKSAGMTVIALTIAPWGKFRNFAEYRGKNTVLVNHWISEQQASHQVDHVIDSYSLLSCGVTTDLCPDYTPPFHDGIHFGPKGHAVLGAALYEKAFKDCR